MTKEWMVCPRCKGDNISSDYFDPETKTQRVLCFDCDFAWLEIFSLVGNETEDGYEIDDIKGVEQ